ncbi:MAG: AzlC family ABC transporter permease [Anaerolineae bacterium]
MSVAVQERRVFSPAGVVAGARQTLAFIPSTLAFGIVWGMLARQAGLTAAESGLMSSLVFAGGAQLVAIQMWTIPVPVVNIILTTLVINLRHLLMGAALYPWLSQLPRWERYVSAFFMVDESWALTVRAHARGQRDAAFLIGSGLVLFVAWVSATLIGQALGAVIADPARWGLDFVSTAVFVALLVAMRKGRANLLPWTTAAIVAIAAWHFVPGKWYILLGGLAGSCVGAWQDGD